MLISYIKCSKYYWTDEVENYNLDPIRVGTFVYNFHIENLPNNYGTQLAKNFIFCLIVVYTFACKFHILNDLNFMEQM